MPGEPEPRHIAKVGVRIPLLARIARNEHAQIVRPAGAAGERERFNLCGVGFFEGHEGLDSHCVRQCEGQTCIAWMLPWMLPPPLPASPATSKPPGALRPISAKVWTPTAPPVLHSRMTPGNGRLPFISAHRPMKRAFAA